MGSAQRSTPTMRPWLPLLLLTASPAAAQTQIIVLYSDGPAAEQQGHRLGLYDRLPGLTHGCPAYRQRDTVGGKVTYLYRQADKDWLAGYELGGNSGGLRSQARLKNCALPSTGWEYGDDDGTFQPTPLKISTRISRTRSCSRVSIRTLNFIVLQAQLNSIGTFTRTSDWSMGRPVYKKGAGYPARVLLVPSGKTNWAVQVKVKSRQSYITSGSAPSLDPTDRRAAKNAKYGRTNWAYWNGREWKQFKFNVKCGRRCPFRDVATLPVPAQQSSFCRFI